MPQPDRNGPRSLEPLCTCSRTSSFALRLCASFAVFSVLILAPSALRAQDQSNQSDQPSQSVADAARQERARKQEQQKTAKHVYTNEDLKRPRILTPEDQAKVEARRNECAQKNNCGPAPAPSKNAPAAVDADAKSAQPSLGEIARELRKQKELDALKPKQSEPFHLPLGEPALASPVVPEHSPLRPPVPPVLRPETRASEPRGIFRRDPFAPVPTRPRVPLDGASRILPAIRPRKNAASSLAPRISRLAPPPSFSVTPAQPTPPAPDSSIAQPVSPALRVQPVRPSLPTKAHRANSPAAPAKIFSVPAPAPTLAIPSVRPTAPVAPVERRQPEVSAAQPVAPAAPVSTPASNAKVIRVQPGDSLWKLAHRNLGRGTLWSQILAANPAITDPKHLRAGANLVLPTRASGSLVPAALGAKAGPANVGATVTVQTGDTLWTLARSNLGRGASWPCLMTANPSITNPDRIFVGQRLMLPSQCRLPVGSPMLR